MSGSTLTANEGSSTTRLAIVNASMRTHGKSFSFAALSLPRELRNDTAAVYAYCRRADDAIDMATPEDASRAIVRLETELAAIYSGVTQSDPVLAAFKDVVERHHVPRHYPSELLAGMQMDVRNVKYDSLSELLGYCYRVAGTVGLMMCHVYGVSDPKALISAAQLGMAMQLTNVCRDVFEDWLRGRCYVPASLLDQAAHGLSRSDGFPTCSIEAWSKAIGTLLGAADEMYTTGEQGVQYLPLRPALAVRTARLVYADIGRLIRKRGADPRAPRAIVPQGRKVVLALKALARTVTEPRAARRLVPLSTIVGVNDVFRV